MQQLLPDPAYNPTDSPALLQFREPVASALAPSSPSRSDEARFAVRRRKLRLRLAALAFEALTFCGRGVEAETSTVDDGAFRVTLTVQPLAGASGPLPFVPTPFQRAILEALEDKGMRTDALGAAVGDRARLFRAPGGIKELQEQGLVAHHARVGFYRPDCPPEVLVVSAVDTSHAEGGRELRNAILKTLKVSTGPLKVSALARRCGRQYTSHFRTTIRLMREAGEVIQTEDKRYTLPLTGGEKLNKPRREAGGGKAPTTIEAAVLDALHGMGKPLPHAVLVMAVNARAGSVSPSDLQATLDRLQAAGAVRCDMRGFMNEYALTETTAGSEEHP